MRDIDGRDPEPAVQLDQLRPRLHPQLGVEVGQRLVHQEHLRLADDGPAEGDALALAARELAGPAQEQGLDAEQAGGFFDALVDVGLGDPAQFQPEGHVVVDAHVRVEGVILEDHGDVPVFGRDGVDQPVADVDVSVGDFFESGDHPQGSGLAAAGRADQHHKLAVLDVERQVLNGDGLVEALDEMCEGDLGQRDAPTGQLPIA